MLDARGQAAQRAIRVVQIRRPLEARDALRGSGVVEIVWMKLPAQVAKPSLEIGRLNRELSRQPHEREIVAVPSEREDPAALRTEVLVYRGPRAAAAALERRDGLDV